MAEKIKKIIKTGMGWTASVTELYKKSFASRMMIVAFHRVNDRPSPDDPLTCTSEEFERFCRYFKAHFHVVSLAQQIAALHAGKSMGGTLSITFDDGYVD